MKYFLSIIGLIGAFAIIKWRQQIGDAIGDADWMRYFGGVYNFLVIVGVFIFIWAIATLTGTTNIFLAPISVILPINTPPPASAPIF